MANHRDRRGSLLEIGSPDEIFDNDRLDELFNVGLSEDRSEDMYVGWVDLMGTKAISARSSSEAGIKTFKLHIAAKWAYESIGGDESELTIVPMMDGVYTFCDDKISLIKFLHGVYTLLAKDVIETERDRFVLAVKGAIAYGPVVMGRNIQDGMEVLQGTKFEERTAAGLPMVQAFETEDRAPPFGVFIHESARAFAPDRDDPFKFVWWEWFTSSMERFSREELASELRDRLLDYYEYCEQNSSRLSYNEDRIQEHRQQVREYFPDSES